jgi:hypothetical protein
MNSIVLQGASAKAIRRHQPRDFAALAITTFALWRKQRLVLALFFSGCGCRIGSEDRST